MEDLVYREMTAEESALDWRITTRVMSDAVLMKTLQESQSTGEKHAVVAIVEAGVLTEAYVSPAEAVYSAPTPPRNDATRRASAISWFDAPAFRAWPARLRTPFAAPCAASNAMAMRSFTFRGKAPSA